MAFLDRAGACVVSAVLLLGTSAFAAMSTPTLISSLTNAEV
jgi:hypothetical protein